MDKNGVYWGYNPLILTFDPNFLGHPSGGLVASLFFFVGCGNFARGEMAKHALLEAQQI